MLWCQPSVRNEIFNAKAPAGCPISALGTGAQVQQPNGNACPVSAGAARAGGAGKVLWLKGAKSLLRTENGLTMDIFVVQCTGVLSRVQMLNLVLGVGVFSFPRSLRIGNGPKTVSESSEHGFKHRAQWVFWPHRGPGRELSEFLSAYYLCAKTNSPSFPRKSPSLPQNSVSSLFRNSTLEKVFRPFPKNVWSFLLTLKSSYFGGYCELTSKSTHRN